MGWCSGTYIFDPMAEAIIDAVDEGQLPEDVGVRFLTILIAELQNQDWDCEVDSDFFEHPLVDRAFRLADPDFAEIWDDDEDTE